jgi:energy-coupling factor transport system permease protein
MLKDITIGQFIPGESIIHHLDPRTKIISVMLFMIGLFVLDRLEAFIGVAILTLLIVWLSRIPLNYLLKGLKPIFIILLFTVGLHFFLTPGTAIWKLGPLKITIEGIKQGIFMSLRLIFLVLVTSLLTLTTSPINLTDGLERLLGPGKKIGIPAHELAMMMSIALRFIPTLLEETEKIMKAQMARGADFESGNLWQRAKSMVPLLVPLFVGAFRRADELALAMEARCYRGSIGRTKMKQLRMTYQDYLALLLLAVFVSWAIIYRIYF